MLRAIIRKKTAFMAVTAIIAFVLLLSLWPLRLYTETFDFAGGDVIEVSESVNAEFDAGEYFIAQYEHLDSIEVYIDSVDAGEKFRFQLFQQEGGINRLLAQEDVAFPDDDLPGYATIPVDADLTPGATYVYTLMGPEAVFRVGFESAEEALANPKAPRYQVAFYHDTGIGGLALSTRLHYSAPLTKVKTFGLMFVVVMVAALLLFLEKHFFEKFQEYNGLTTVQRTMQVTLTPVVVLVGLAFALMIFPFRMYDSRVLDVVMYESGVILATLTALYGLWHDRTGVPSWFPSLSAFAAEWRSIVIAVLVAFIFKFSCDYMNAVSDYIHRDSMHGMIILLCFVILLMGKWSWWLNLWTLGTAIVSTIAGVWYYHGNAMPKVQFEAVYVNTNLATLVAAWIVTAVTVVSTIIMLVEVHSRRRNVETPDRAPISWWIAAPTAAFFLLAVINRGNRTWLPVMAGIWLLFYIRFAYYPHRDSWLRTVSVGIMMHFGCTVIWSMLHRYYLAYNFNRFSMQFHTVTITAYYYLIVSAAALSMFLLKLRDTQGMKLRERLRHLWIEVLLLGSVISYMLMSLTRAGVYSLAVMAIFAIVTVFIREKKAVLRMLQAVLAMILVFILTLPMVFTGQRVISTTVAKPVIFAPVEEYYDLLLRNTKWNSVEFMNVEIFIRDVGDRLIGGGIGSKLYYRMRWNIEQGYDTAMRDWIASPLLADNELTPDDVITQEEYESQIVSDEVIDGITNGSGVEDFSNGRTEIWRTYANELNMNGHEGMDTVAENGEVLIHAHNTYLQTAYDCGIPAGILFLVWLFLTGIGTCIYYSRIERRRDAADHIYCAVPLLAMIGFGITGMVEWIFHLCNPYTVMLMMVLAPVMMSAKRSTKTNKGTK